MLSRKTTKIVWTVISVVAVLGMIGLTLMPLLYG